PGGPLRHEHLHVDTRLLAEVAAEHLQHAVEPRGRVLPRHQAGDGDRAGVHHRVHRPVRLRVEHDRVERVAGRLDADDPADLLAAQRVQHQPVDEDVRDGLEGEADVGVPDGVDVAGGRDHGDAEPVGVDLGELGDVGGDLAVAVAAVGQVQLVEHGQRADVVA